VKLLVTGGLGFIGSAFVRLFHDKYDIHIVDAMTYAADITNLEGLLTPVTICDIGDVVRMNDLFYSFDPDVVVNFASETHVDRSITDDSIFYRSNVLGVLNLLHLCRKYKTKRFQQISTDEIYGQLLPEDPAWTEDSPIKPRNPYAASKAAAEHLVMAYHQTHGMDVVVTRGANTYGPHQMEKLIPTALKRLSEGKPVPVYGQGLQMRDWLYVDDHARAVERVMLRGKPGNVYNIPGTQEMRNIDMVQHLIKAWGSDPETSIEFVGERLGHDFRYHMDGSKLKRLGWLHETTFEQGIEKTVAWYQEFLGR